jgi:hypothetical protein
LKYVQILKNKMKTKRKKKTKQEKKQKEKGFLFSCPRVLSYAQFSPAA